MSASPPKDDPAGLSLRARPRPVTRLSRRVLIALLGLAALGVLGAAIVALDPPRLGSPENEPGPDFVGQKPTANGLSSLPESYADLTPKLGPPLPGDLGPGMVEAERQAGLTEPLPPRAPTTNLGPDPEEELARQQRLERARELEQARTAGVFFQINAEAAQGEPDSTRIASATPAEERDLGQAEDLQVLDVGTSQNLQDQKRDFLEEPRDPVTYSPYAIRDPASPYQVMAGTIIPAALITGINSDLPGQVTAQVTEPVYDTVTGQHLLIPQGTRLIGTYDSLIAFGQERALLIWTRVILPDGSSMVLDNLPGADAGGYAGLADEVDFHTWRLLKGVALATLLGISGELAAGDDENRIIAAGRESLFGAANQVGQEITRRNLDVQPTLTIRPGFPLRVIVTRDLVLRSYQEPE